MSTNKRTLKKAKLSSGKDGHLLEVTYLRDPDKTSVTESHKTPVHPDLVAAFGSLAIHLGLLLEFIQPKQVRKIDEYDPALVENLSVHGISIGGDDEDPGIVITGMRTLSNNKVHPLNTPFTRYNENELTAYKYIQNVQDAVTLIDYEIAQFLDKGKVKPDAQLGLDFDAAPDQSEVAKMPNGSLPDHDAIDDAEDEAVHASSNGKGNLLSADGTYHDKEDLAKAGGKKQRPPAQLEAERRYREKKKEQRQKAGTKK